VHPHVFTFFYKIKNILTIDQIDKNKCPLRTFTKQLKGEVEKIFQKTEKNNIHY